MNKGLEQLLARIEASPNQLLIGRYLALIAELSEEQGKSAYALNLAQALLRHQPVDALHIAHMVHKSDPHNMQAFEIMIAALVKRGRHAKAAMLRLEQERRVAQAPTTFDKPATAATTDFAIDGDEAMHGLSMATTLLVKDWSPATRQTQQSLVTPLLEREALAGDAFAAPITFQPPVKPVPPPLTPGTEEVVFAPSYQQEAHDARAPAVLGAGLQEIDPAALALSSPEGGGLGAIELKKTTVSTTQPAREGSLLRGIFAADARTKVTVSSAPEAEADGKSAATAGLAQRFDLFSSALTGAERGQSVHAEAANTGALIGAEPGQPVRPALADAARKDQPKSARRPAPAGNDKASRRSPAADRRTDGDSGSAGGAAELLDQNGARRPAPAGNGKASRRSAAADRRTDGDSGSAGAAAELPEQNSGSGSVLPDAVMSPGAFWTPLHAAMGRLNRLLDGSSDEGDALRARLQQLQAQLPAAAGGDLPGPFWDAVATLGGELPATGPAREQALAMLWEVCTALSVPTPPPALAPLLAKLGLVDEHAGFWGLYLDALVAGGAGRKALADIREQLQRRHQLPWARAAWRRLPSIWLALGVRGFSWREEEGIAALLAGLAKRPAPTMSVLVI